MSFMNGYDQPNIYIFNFWSLDEISNWNDEVSRNCDSAGGLATQSPDTPFRQSQDLIASEESPVILKETLGPGVSFQPGPKHSASHTQEQTEPFFFRKSPLTTREHVSEAFLFSPRLNTPSLTDVSTVVPGYPSSVSDGSAKGPCPPTPPLILFNASAGYGNQLSTTESSTSLPLSSLTSAAKVEDRYICLFPGCELTFRRVADLKRHGLKHISLAFPCPILGCGFRSFTRRDKLLDHARRVHPEAHLSKFEAVNLNSTFHTTKTLAASGDHQSVHDTETDTCRSPCRELKKEMTRPGSDFSPDSLDTFTPVFDAHIQSQLAEVTHTHSNPSQASTNIQTASDSTAQAVGADLAVSSEKIVDHDKQKSISLSLWPAQYLALLDLGIIQRVEANLKSETHQCTSCDDAQVVYRCEGKSLCLVGPSPKVDEAELLLLEGIETLTSDRKAQARHELWCRHLVPELRSASSQAFEETSDSANVIEPATTVYGKDSIARSINSDVFILREDLDKDLINAWHTTVLPALDDMISSASDPSIVVSLQREGLNEVESHAVIRVRSSIKRSAFEKDRLKHDLLSVLPEKLRSDCTVEFSKGSIQRSGGDTKTMETGEHHPPICEPRNRRWVHKPTMGASIGRWGSEDHTATLGGYVVIDGITYILTVHHLFEDEKKVQASENGGLRRGQYRITQPSQQELRDIDVEVLSLRNKIGRFEAGQETLLQWMSQIRALERLQDMIPREKDLLSFGEVVASSGYRSRVSRARTANQSSLGTGWPMEMDWAICSVIEDRIGDNELDVQLRCNESGASAFQLARGGTSQNPSDKKNMCTKTCEVFGGIAVHSLGRTSHYQTGLVSPCQAWIRQGNAVGGFRSSFEWTIVRPAAKSIKEWNEGGMGVDGDSGSWIVREHSNELMGMLWGRYQDDDIEDPITFFTPIHDVFDDIIDTLGPKRIGLPQEQNPSTSALRAGSLNSAASRVPLITDSLAPSTKRRYPPSPEKIPPAKRKDLGAPHRRCRCSQPTFPLQLTPPATPARYA